MRTHAKQINVLFFYIYIYFSNRLSCITHKNTTVLVYQFCNFLNWLNNSRFVIHIHYTY